MVNDPSENIVSGGDLRILVGQFTTDGELSGQLNFQMFNMGLATDDSDVSIPFAGVGQVDSTSEIVCGCTDESACNYNMEATNDDGSCEFVSCLGCIDSASCNFQEDATQDDGSCEYASCAETCYGDLNGDGSITVGDLLTVLSDFGCASSCNADIDGDDQVSVQDLLALLSVFGEVCN